MFIRHLKPQLKRCHSEPQLKECHVFNPYPKLQHKGYVLSDNSRNTPASQPLRYHQSLVDHAYPSRQNTSPASALSLGTTTEPPGKTPVLAQYWFFTLQQISFPTPIHTTSRCSISDESPNIFYNWKFLPHMDYIHFSPPRIHPILGLVPNFIKIPPHIRLIQ